MKKSSLLVVLIIFLLQGCSWYGERISKASAEVRIYAVREGKMISKRELLSQLARADYVLLGEEHGNIRHHDVQQSILEGIVRYGKKPAVILEMLDLEDAGIINSTQRQYPNQLAAAVDWANGGWPDWQFYRPLVKTAMDAKLRLAPGNIPSNKFLALAFNDGMQGLEKRQAQQRGLLQPLHPQRVSSTYSRDCPMPTGSVYPRKRSLPCCLPSDFAMRL